MMSTAHFKIDTPKKYICVYIYICVYTYTCVYVYTYIHVYTHIYIYWLCWVFVAASGPSLAVESRSYSLTVVHGLPITVASPVVEQSL